MVYHVAEPNSYLVITGIGIEQVLIKKKVTHTALLSPVRSRLTDTGICMAIPEGHEDINYALRFQYGHPSYDC
jgi:hypothetical protein